MRAVLLALAVLTVAACGSGVPSIDLPTPPTTRKGATPTTLPDYSAVGLAAIPGATTTTSPQLAPGSSRITGTVRGPDGPIGGATVRIERFVGDTSARADIITAPDGTFVSDPILGGRYRVRAWRAPDLVVDKPVLFYLDDAKTQPVDLVLNQRTGVGVRGSISPTPLYEEELAALVVSVTTTTVDDNGIVRVAPIQGVTVTLSAPSGWQVFSSNPQVTDGSGRVAWQVRCSFAGSTGFYANAGGQTYPLDIPACDTPPTTTTTEAGATTSSSSSFTTTTRRRGGGGGGGGNGQPGPP